MKHVRTLIVAMMLVAILSASFGTPAYAGGKQDPCDKKDPPPECQVPEVPWTLVLPLAGVAIAGGYYLIDRRRHRYEAPDA